MNGYGAVSSEPKPFEAVQASIYSEAAWQFWSWNRGKDQEKEIEIQSSLSTSQADAFFSPQGQYLKDEQLWSNISGSFLTYNDVWSKRERKGMQKKKVTFLDLAHRLNSAINCEDWAGSVCLIGRSTTISRPFWAQSDVSLIKNLVSRALDLVHLLIPSGELQD